MTYIIILVILAVFGNIAFRRYIAKIYQKVPKPQTDLNPSDAQKDHLSIQSDDVLRAWGKSAPGKIELAGPLNASLSKLLQEYETVGPDQYFLPIDRKFAVKPFSENSTFVQVGTWGDGSEVLAKRDPLDNAVYLADLEDSDPQNPIRIATSLEGFLAKAWEYHQDSVRKG
jgi:hypothetical protein